MTSPWCARVCSRGPTSPRAAYVLNLMSYLAALCARSPWRSSARLAAGGSMRAGGATQPRTHLAVFCACASVLSTVTRRTRYFTRVACPRTGWSCRLRGGAGAAPHELSVTRLPVRIIRPLARMDSI